MDGNMVLGVIGLIFVGATALVGVTVFILKQVSDSEEKLSKQSSNIEDKLNARITTLDEKVRDQITGFEDKLRTQVANAEEKFRLMMEKRDSDNSKARHDLANELTKPFGKLDLRLERLDGDAARKDELRELERRINLAISEIKTTFEKVVSKLEALPVIERDLKALTAQMERIANNQGAD